MQKIAQTKAFSSLEATGGGIVNKQEPMRETQAFLPVDDPRWAEAERALWWAISCRNFSKRQKRLLMFLLKESIGRGRGKAYVSSLESFDEYTRLHVSHVSETLSFLKAARVIAEYPQHCYGFRFPISDWTVLVLPERMYHEEQLALIEAPPELEDTLREVFIDSVENLPARGRGNTAVHPDRSRPDPGQGRDKTGGAASREPDGSVPDDQAEATGRPIVPQWAATISPEAGNQGKPFPESGNISRIGKIPAGSAGIDFPNRETPQNPMATAKTAPFPESGNAGSTALVQYCSNASKKQYCTDTRGGEEFPDSGNAQRRRPAVQQCSSALEAGERKTKKFTEAQQQLFDELAALRGNGPRRLPVFGNKDQWFGFWVLSVRDRFEVTQELLGEVKYAMISRTIDDPGAWMMDKWSRWGRPGRRRL